MNKFDLLFNDLVESNIDQFLEHEDFYNAQANGLKSAKTLKEEHQQRVRELLKMKDFRHHLEDSEQLILNNLKTIISEKEANKIKQEFEQANEHCINYIQNRQDKENESNQPVLLKDLFGISNDSLLRIYALVQNFVHHKRYEDAKKILVFLTTMNPQVSSFWLAQGLCLQNLSKDQEAIEVYHIVKILDPENIEPFIRAAKSYIRLNEKENASHELKEAGRLLKIDKNSKWKDALDNLTHYISK